MSDPELRPGVDRPSRRQYVAGAVIIVLLAALAYWLRAC